MHRRLFVSPPTSTTDRLVLCGFEPEVGWGLRPDFGGRGSATESARAIVDYGFEALNTPKLFAIANPQNYPTRRLMDRLDFAFSDTISETMPGIERGIATKPGGRSIRGHAISMTLPVVALY